VGGVSEDSAMSTAARRNGERGGAHDPAMVDARSDRRPAAHRVRRALILLAVLWLAVAVLAPLVGSRPLSLAAVLHGDPAASAIFWQLRAPRVLLALLAGGLLALSGLSLQTLFGNALAEPYTLGVASGASLGAALVFTFAPRVTSLGLPLAADRKSTRLNSSHR